MILQGSVSLQGANNIITESTTKWGQLSSRMLGFNPTDLFNLLLARRILQISCYSASCPLPAAVPSTRHGLQYAIFTIKGKDDPYLVDLVTLGPVRGKEGWARSTGMLLPAPLV